MVNDKNRFLLSVGYSVIVLAASIELISTIFYVSGVPISKFNFWIPFLATIIFIRFMSMYNKESTKLYLWNIGILAGIFLIGSFFSNLFYDLSYDGQAYQQEGVIQIAKGWNPYRGIPILGYVHDLWINHLAKGPWILSAVFYQVTGIIETSKVFNFALLISSLIIAVATLLTFFPKQKGKALIIGLLLGLNPVAIVQLTSFYSDGQLYSLLLIICCLLSLLYRQYGMWELVMLCLAILLLVNISFSALLYTLVIVLGFFAILVMMRKRDVIKQIVGPIVTSLLLSVLVVGYNPYVTNSMEKGNPFYPLMGKDAVDTTVNSPSNFINSNPIKNLARSVLSQSSNDLSPSKVKIPFTVEKGEIQAFISPDVRVGGFGPLFGSVLLAAVILFLLLLLWDRKKLLYIMTPGLILFISVVISKEMWWARNTPQFWLFPLIVILFAIFSNKKAPNILSWGLVALLSLNIMVVAGYHLKTQYQLSRQIDAQLDELASSGKKIEVKLNNHLSNRIRFQERNIKHNLVDVLPCNNPKSFPLSEAQYCE